MKLRFTTYFFQLLLLTQCVVTCFSQDSGNCIGDAALCKTWKKLNLDSSCNSGLSVFDLSKNKFLLQVRDKSFFIPASETKILTLYAALHSLGDTLDAAYYISRGDSLIFWGGGDPGTRYPNVEMGSLLVDKIRYALDKIYFSNNHFQTTRYGSGWAWDDHSYVYQCERNAFPLYGNRLWIDRYVDTITVLPRYFTSLVSVQKDTINKISRSEWGDEYMYNYKPSRLEDHRTIPITFFKNDLRLMWKEATGKDITICNLPLDPNAKKLRGSVRDSMLYTMMQVSDNFIAEQILLAGSLKTKGVMNEKLMIRSMLDGPMSFITDTIQWVDGSGRSRYSLMTPATFIEVLSRLYEEKGMNFIQSMFLPGGLPNTNNDWYIGKDGEPFVYAKSGSMRNVQNLSGYLITRKGKILVFSWLNNQCMASKPYLASSIQKMLTQLYEDY